MGKKAKLYIGLLIVVVLIGAAFYIAKVYYNINLFKEIKADEIAKDEMKYINANLPYIQEAGYKLTNVQIRLALVPEIVLKFEKTKEVDEKKIKKILETHQDNTRLVTIIELLIQGNSVQKDIKVGNLKFKSQEIILTIPPSISLEFE